MQELVRPMARQGIEHYARSHGRPLVDEETLAEARQRFGMWQGRSSCASTG